jgi:hypothetical protein
VAHRDRNVDIIDIASTYHLFHPLDISTRDVPGLSLGLVFRRDRVSSMGQSRSRSWYVRQARGDIKADR